MPEIFCRKTTVFSIMRKVTSAVLVLTFSVFTVVGPAGSQIIVGQTIGLTSVFVPPVLKGMSVHAENPLLFDFIVDRGQDKINNAQLKDESTRLIKYFLAAMTIPDKDAWVNLSPYEKDRIIPDALGQTEMGRQMLEQDYMLKQLAASLTNPDTPLGKQYWDEVRRLEMLTPSPQSLTPDQLNKVWIIPDGATVVEKDGFAYITQSKLNVMLDEEYQTTTKNTVIASPVGARQSSGLSSSKAFIGDPQSPNRFPLKARGNDSKDNIAPATASQTLDAKQPTFEKNSTSVKSNDSDILESPSLVKEGAGGVQFSSVQPPATNDQGLSPSISSQVFRKLILPKLIEEVNTGKSFAPTRQVYQSVILAAWYKKALKDSLLGRIYADKSKVAGVETDIKDIKQKVYEQYLEAFKKGAYSVIKEELDSEGDLIPRKYFSGGLKLGMSLNPNQLIVDRSSSAVNRVAVEINRASADQLALVAASGVETGTSEADALLTARGVETLPVTSSVNSNPNKLDGPKADLRKKVAKKAREMIRSSRRAEKTPEAATVDLLEELLTSQISGSFGSGQVEQFDGELDQVFRQYSPEAYEIIGESGVPFYMVATELLNNNAFIREDLDGRCLSCEQTAMKFFSPLFSANDEMINSLKILLEFAYQPTAQSQTFLLKISQIKANIDFEKIKARAFLEKENNFPDNPLPGTVYFDLASGPHFARFMPGFDLSTHYIAVDNSPFVVEYLREVQRLLGGVSNVDILQADLMTLERPSLPVGVIRVKNVWRYVDEFAPKLREMSQWIAPKGQLLIQTDPDMVQRKSAIQFLGDFPEQLISAGWTFEYEFGDERSARMDRLIFTKEARSNSQLPQLTWSDYVKDLTSRILQDSPQASSSASASATVVNQIDANAQKPSDQRLAELMKLAPWDASLEDPRLERYELEVLLRLINDENSGSRFVQQEIEHLLKNAPDKIQEILQIGVGRGVTAIQYALRYPAINVTAVNRFVDEWGWESAIVHAVHAENSLRPARGQNPITFAEIKDAINRIKVVVVDIQDAGDRKAILGDKKFDGVFFEPFVQLYFDDNIRTIEGVFNERVAVNGFMKFDIDPHPQGYDWNLRDPNNRKNELDPTDVIRLAFSNAEQDVRHVDPRGTIFAVSRLSEQDIRIPVKQSNVENGTASRAYTELPTRISTYVMDVAASSGVESRRNFLKAIGAVTLLPFLPHSDANAASFSYTEGKDIAVVSKGRDTFESIVQQLTTKALLDKLDAVKKKEILGIAFEKFKQENPNIKFEDIDKPFAPGTKFLSRDTHDYLAFAVYMALSDVVAQQTVWVSGQNVPIYYVNPKTDIVYAGIANTTLEYGIIVNMSKLNDRVIQRRKDFLASLTNQDAPAHFLSEIFVGKNDKEAVQDMVVDLLTHEIAHSAMHRNYNLPVQSDEAWITLLLDKYGPVVRQEVWAYLVQIAKGKMPRTTMNILQLFNDKRLFNLPTGAASRIVIWSMLDELGFGDYWADEEIKAQQASGVDLSWFKKAAYRFVISRDWSKKEHPLLGEYQAAKMDQFLATKTTQEINEAATRVFERLSGRNIPWISQDLQPPEQVINALLAASSSGVEESLMVDNTRVSSPATSNFTKGGIDFDPSKLNLQIKRDGHGVPLPLLQQDIENININGLYPVILNILPVNAQTLPILGQLNVQPEAVLSKG